MFLHLHLKSRWHGVGTTLLILPDKIRIIILYIHTQCTVLSLSVIPEEHALIFCCPSFYKTTKHNMSVRPFPLAIKWAATKRETLLSAHLQKCRPSKPLPSASCHSSSPMPLATVRTYGSQLEKTATRCQRTPWTGTRHIRWHFWAKDNIHLPFLFCFLL